LYGSLSLLSTIPEKRIALAKKAMDRRPRIRPRVPCHALRENVRPPTLIDCQASRVSMNIRKPPATIRIIPGERLSFIALYVTRDP
jgi:hypothetical protein